MTYQIGQIIPATEAIDLTGQELPEPVWHALTVQGGRGPLTGQKKRARAMKRNKRKRTVSLSTFNGDHGTGTIAATLGTKLEEVKTEDGKNPNKYARRRRINQIEELHKRGTLSQRQYQAAEAIQTAHCKVEKLSSGGPLKVRVDTSAKPDAATDMQVEAVSRMIYLTRCIPPEADNVVKAVCMKNLPISAIAKGRRHEENKTLLLAGLDAVADKLRY